LNNIQSFLYNFNRSAKMIARPYVAAALSAFAAFAAPVHAAMTATELADSLGVLAHKTYAIRPIVNNINGTSSTQTYITQGPILVSSLVYNEDMNDGGRYHHVNQSTVY
jgi:hypothetical protein